MKILKQSTSTTLLLGPFVDSTDGFTSETALTISQSDVLLWKEGGTTLAQKNDATACTHRSNGLYTCPINATDTDTLGILTVSVSEAGALPVRHDFHVVPAVVYNSLILGTDTLDVQVTGMGNDVVTAAVIANGAIDANTFATGAITGAAIATDAIDTDALSAGALTDIQGAVQAALEANHLDHLLAVDYDPNSKPGVATALFNELIESDAGVSRFTTNALEQGPSGGGGGSNPLILRDNTAQAGTLSTMQLDSGASSTDDLYTYNMLAINAGTGVGQSRQIVSYDGATKTATVFPNWEIAPDATSEFLVAALGVDAASVTDIVSGVWGALRADHNISGSFGEYVRADMIRISSDSVAADNLEALVDGTGLTLTNVLLPWNAAWDAEVQSEVQDAIELNHLDHLLAVAYDPASKPGSSTSLFNALVEDDGGLVRFTTNVLEQAPTGGGPADGSSFVNIPWNAAWDAEVQSECADAITAASVVTQTALDLRTLPAADYATAAAATAIEADTQDLQSRVPASLDNGRMRVKIEQVVDKVLVQGGTGGFSIGAS